MSKKGMKRFTARFLTGVMVVGLFSGMTPEYVVEAATIDSLPDISITMPVVGAIPENEVNDGNGGTIELSWTGDLNDGKFKCGVEYTVTYTVEAGQDDTFDESIEADGVELNDDRTTATITITYSALDHNLGDSQGQAATCVTDGWKDYYVCNSCQKTFADSYGKEKIDDVDAWMEDEEGGKLEATGDHEGSEVAAEVAATCGTDGTKAIHKCDGCQKFYIEGAEDTVYETQADAEAAEAAKLVATGHAYSAPTWTWTGYTSATATFKCANCNDTKEIAATITKEETPATAEKEGRIVYTATATFNGETVTDTKEETLPKTGKTDYATVLNGVDYSAVYDFNYYVNKYPDIKKAFGNDDVAVLKHFVTYGMKEGRQASAEFNLTYYRNRYADLRAAYGNNNASYYTHYIKYGKGEKRDAKTATELVGVTKLNGVDYSPIYNYNYYVNKYPDIKKAFGNDDVAVLKHFVTYGMKEGRQASAEFNLTYYRNRYADLRAAYGNNNASYYTHYIKYGKKERRDAKTATELVGITMLNGVNYSQIYNYNYYVNKYADIKKAFGNDDVAVLKHFVTYGMKEGRQASENFNINVYKNRYADLQKAFGSDNAKYYMHYLTYGIKEGRKAK